MDYKIVSARSVSELEKRVADLIDNEGYEPIGGLAISNAFAYQAMIRKPDSTYMSATAGTTKQENLPSNTSYPPLFETNPPNASLANTARYSIQIFGEHGWEDQGKFEDYDSAFRQYKICIEMSPEITARMLKVQPEILATHIAQI